MSDKHLGVSLEHHIEQSRKIKRLEKQIARQRCVIADGIKLMLQKSLTGKRCAALIDPEVYYWADKAAKIAGLSVDLDVTTQPTQKADGLNEGEA